jgi:hypothetical protein
MALAIFGISNSGLNLAVTLFILMIVVVWLALIVYTYLDARRRISDPFLLPLHRHRGLRNCAATRVPRGRP